MTMNSFSIGNKEFLLGYINTLTESECRRIYLVVKDEVDCDGKWYMFDCYGCRVNQNPSVMLTQKQLETLLELWGEHKTKQIIALQGKLNDSKPCRDEIDKRSDYFKMVTHTESYYYKLHRLDPFFADSVAVGDEENCIPFTATISLKQAKEFIKRIPQEVRDTDGYCLWLHKMWGESLYKD